WLPQKSNAAVVPLPCPARGRNRIGPWREHKANIHDHRGRAAFPVKSRSSLFSGKFAVARSTVQRHERGCLAAPSLLLLHFGREIEEFQRLAPDLFQLARARPPVRRRVDPAEPG